MREHPTPIPVSPGLHRPGLDPGGIWIASCPTCGYQLVSGHTQERVERKAARRTCPICNEIS
jgi:hypothetical protein